MEHTRKYHQKPKSITESLHLKTRKRKLTIVDISRLHRNLRQIHCSSSFTCWALRALSTFTLNIICKKGDKSVYFSNKVLMPITMQIQSCLDGKNTATQPVVIFKRDIFFSNRSLKLKEMVLICFPHEKMGNTFQKCS